MRKKYRETKLICKGWIYLADDAYTYGVYYWCQDCGAMFNDVINWPEYFRTGSDCKQKYPGGEE